MASDLQKELQYKTALLNAIKIKREELQDLEQSLKTVNESIFQINNDKQGELNL